MIEDPTPRPDGSCVVCGKQIPATASRYAPADAFCRTKCCRVFFGNPDQFDQEEEKIQ